jgi:hypothetical protein
MLFPAVGKGGQASRRPEFRQPEAFPRGGEASETTQNIHEIGSSDRAPSMTLLDRGQLGSIE